MIKNEDSVIEQFINHHINIVDNILLIDNGSKDNTINIIQKYPEINLIHRNDDFNLKSSVFSEYINRSKYDIIIPMDADELLVYDDDNTIINKNQSLIKDYLNSLLKLNNNLFKVKNIYNYIPNTDNKYLIEKDKWRSRKFFFKRKDFISTCPGFHSIEMNDKSTHSSKISYLHYHYLNFDYWYKSSKQKMMARLGDNWNNIDILKTYSGYSNHTAKELVRFFTTNQWHDE
jgi:hypothetical protein